MLVPRFSIARFGVKYDATDNGSKWGGTKVKWSIEKFPRQDAGAEGCLAHEVESQISLGKELVPHVAGEIRIDVS